MSSALCVLFLHLEACCKGIFACSTNLFLSQPLVAIWGTASLAQIYFIPQPNMQQPNRIYLWLFCLETYSFSTSVLRGISVPACCEGIFFFLKRRGIVLDYSWLLRVCGHISPTKSKYCDIVVGFLIGTPLVYTIIHMKTIRTNDTVRKLFTSRLCITSFSAL